MIESWNDGQLQPSRVLIFESSPLLDSECTLLKERGEFGRRAWREWRSSSSVTDFEADLSVMMPTYSGRDPQSRARKGAPIRERRHSAANATAKIAADNPPILVGRRERPQEQKVEPASARLTRFLTRGGDLQ